MFEVLLVVYLLAALGIIGLVLIQQGKGADMGASFGAGASNTVFGAGGSGNFLTRSTAIFAVIFFCVCLAFGHIIANDSGENSILAPSAEIQQELKAKQEAARDAAEQATIPAAPVSNPTTEDIPK